MRCGKGCPATAGHPRKISKKDSGGLPERWKNRELSKKDSEGLPERIEEQETFEERFRNK